MTEFVFDQDFRAVQVHTHSRYRTAVNCRGDARRPLRCAFEQPLRRSSIRSRP